MSKSESLAGSMGRLRDECGLLYGCSDERLEAVFILKLGVGESHGKANVRLVVRVLVQRLLRNAQ